MHKNDDVQFIPSSIKIPNFSSSSLSQSPSISISITPQNPNFPFLKPPFSSQSLKSPPQIPKFSLTHFLKSLNFPKYPTFFQFLIPRSNLCTSSLSLSQPGEANSNPLKLEKAVTGVSGGGEERVLIKEVLVRGIDGKELGNEELEEEVFGALRACYPNSALSSSEVQEDVHRVIDSGSFASCRPVVLDSRDGAKLVFEVEPNEEFRGLVCEGANILPSKIIKESFSDGYGKVVNIRRLSEVINSINGWYMERGLLGMVSGVEMLSEGILRLQIAEAEVNDISVYFYDKKTHEPTVGRTKPGTISRELLTKKGQVYSLQQAEWDAESVRAMGIMEDVSVIRQAVEEKNKFNLVMNVIERDSGGVSAGGGISSGIMTNTLSSLIGSIKYSHGNLFGKNHKVNVSVERGQIDSKFRVNYKVPWIEGDDKRTCGSVMAMNSRTPGTLVHGNQPDGSSLAIDCVTAGVQFSRPLRPKWNGTVGLTFQRAGVRDENGNPVFLDFHGSPLTASGNTHDNTVLSKCEFVYTGESRSSMLVFSMEQGLPVLPEWLRFNRVNGRGWRRVKLGPTNLHLSLVGGHVVGNFSPHEAFALGGTDSVRGYEEGAVGTGRSFVIGSGEFSFPLYDQFEGAVFADYGTDLGSGPSVPGDPAGVRLKPGSGYGYGVGLRFASPIGPLRLEYALNDRRAGKFHFGVGNRY